MPKLVLIRHGESNYNKLGLFTGWIDTKLSDKGRDEVQKAGELLKESGIKIDVAFTSVLSRAIQTANIALDVADQLWVPLVKNWRLNERHYGDLQGKNKAEALEHFGPEKFKEYRRSYDIPPPPIAADSKFSQVGERRYSDLAPEVVPLTESLKDVIERLIPYWQDEIAAKLLDGKTVAIFAHGNSLRGLIKHLDGLTNDEVSNLNVPTAQPLVYELDDQLKPIKHYYLDEEGAKAGAAAVAAQGQKK
ncbi:GPM1 [Candida pseudojiufengensis]|uniref:GPM1 n=1 Tax=Candida pseudojiufengensis TaxID=497109 RepID=UPI002224A0AA|nr:GPM1 [Candida pseudojiufengensis]KAI5958957.1 GPM1 [Candida pseudojiufengensis]